MAKPYSMDFARACYGGDYERSDAEAVALRFEISLSSGSYIKRFREKGMFAGQVRGGIVTLSGLARGDERD